MDFVQGAYQNETGLFEFREKPDTILHHIYIPYYHKGYRSYIRVMYIDERKLTSLIFTHKLQQSHSIIVGTMLVYLNLVTTTKGPA